jgi:hypothetical protein
VEVKNEWSYNSFPPSIFLPQAQLSLGRILIYLLLMYKKPLKTNIFWDLMTYNIVKLHCLFRATLCLHLQGRSKQQARYIEKCDKCVAIVYCCLILAYRYLFYPWVVTMETINSSESSEEFWIAKQLNNPGARLIRKEVKSKAIHVRDHGVL